MSNKSTEEIIMGIILNAGDAKQMIYEALSLVKKGEFEKSELKAEEAQESVTKAHNFQTEWLTKEAAGDTEGVTALFVHAQDHLMTTMSEINLINEIIELRKELMKN